jgi:hypothetical protein
MKQILTLLAISVMVHGSLSAQTSVSVGARVQAVGAFDTYLGVTRLGDDTPIAFAPRNALATIGADITLDWNADLALRASAYTAIGATGYATIGCVTIEHCSDTSVNEPVDIRLQGWTLDVLWSPLRPHPRLRPWISAGAGQSWHRVGFLVNTSALALYPPEPTGSAFNTQLGAGVRWTFDRFHVETGAHDRMTWTDRSERGVMHTLVFSSALGIRVF